MPTKENKFAVENQNTDNETFSHEELRKDASGFELTSPAEQQAVIWPGAVGPAEILMLVVFVIQMVTLPFADPNPNLSGAVSIGLCLSLPSMLAAWSSIRLGVWRYSLAVFLSLINGFLLTSVANPEFDLLLVMLPLFSALPVLLTLVIIKQCFGHFAPLAPDAGQFLEGLRFNLSHLFIVTTLLAVLLPIGKFFWPTLSSNSAHAGKFVIIFGLSILFSFNTLMYVWALQGKRAIMRVCIAIPVGLATLMLCAMVCSNTPNDPIWYLIAGLPLVLSFVMLAALRFSGWRFFRGTAF